MKTTIYKNYLIKIVQDDYPESPLEWDMVAQILCLHGRYRLGHNHNYRDTEYLDQQIEERVKRGGVALELFLYDHSGITISTNPFSCPWDSGKIGYIVAQFEKVKEEFGGDIEKVKACLESEIKIYDQYLTGDVWGFQIVNPYGEDLDSCYGHYGYDYCLSEAKAIVDTDIEHTKSYVKQLPDLVCNAD